MIPPDRDPSPFGLWLAFTMYVSAAYADATGSQRAQMQERVRPVLPELKKNSLAGLTILKEVYEIMGPGWHPTGDYEQWLRALLQKETPVALPQPPATAVPVCETSPPRPEMG